MSAQGLFHEKNKTNYFNGIYAIKDQDLERDGSYLNHLFYVVKLLIEVLEKTNDFKNMIELSRGLYPEPEKKYLEDSQRVYFANLSLETSFNILTVSFDLELT